MVLLAVCLLLTALNAVAHIRGFRLGKPPKIKLRKAVNGALAVNIKEITKSVSDKEAAEVFDSVAAFLRNRGLSAADEMAFFEWFRMRSATATLSILIEQGRGGMEAIDLLSRHLSELNEVSCKSLADKSTLAKALADQLKKLQELRKGRHGAS